MVEVAWYLPGTHEDNTFPFPVTFANLRQNIEDSNVVLDSLCDTATVTCFFADEMNDKVEAMVKGLKHPKKLVLVILHSKEKEKNVKERCK